MNTLCAAIQAFVQTESSKKVKRILWHKIRVSSEEFKPGDKVYYKREMSQKWKGPGFVIGQDRKVVFVRHGSVNVRVPPNRLTKKGEEFRNIESKNVENHKPCSDSEKENAIQHKEDDDTKTKSKSNNDVITNDTH